MKEDLQMITMVEQHSHTSPMRLIEMLSDRFGVFEAIASSTIKLARFVSEDELPMDPLVAEAVLEFASDLRSATAASGDWARAEGLTLAGSAADGQTDETH
jgi:multisubunit Na+/H+ antiporter MnhE subunit